MNLHQQAKAALLFTGFFAFPLLALLHIESYLPQPDIARQPGRLNYTKEEVPPYLVEQGGILTGYRANLTLSECFWSIFRWHNETINIWTHGIAAILFSRLVWRYYQSNKKQPAAVLILCATKAFVFSVSFFAHTFSPVNELWYRFCWKLDWSAIAMAIFGTCNAAAYFGFYRHAHKQRFWQNIFRISCGFMFVTFNLPTFTLLSSGFKGIGVVVLCVPCFAAFLIDAHRVLTPQEAATIFRDMASPLLLATLGVTIYGSQTPERWYSGTFDCIGHSHNLHHAWTIFFAYLMLRNVLNWSQWRANDQKEPPV